MNATVAQYMSQPVLSAAPDDTFDEVFARFERLGLSCLAVVEDGAYVGVISRTDLLRVGTREAERGHEHSLLSFPHEPIAQLMIYEVVTVSPDTSIEVAARLMVDGHLHRVFVEEDGAPVGVLSTRDLMSAVVDAGINAPISAFMSSPVLTVPHDMLLGEATAMVEAAHVSGVVVVEDEWPVGVFTQRDALEAAQMPRETRVDVAMCPAMLCLPTTTPMRRAAAQTLATRPRRVIAVADRFMEGLLTGIDFAKALVGDDA